jgi:hypothetical protein
MALIARSAYVCGMKLNWTQRKWVLAGGGGLAAVCFLGALFLAISGKRDQWITLALSGALIAVAVLQFVRRDRPDT